MTLDELIGALESATGPSRELDEAIMAIFYKREARHIGTREDDGTGWKPVADDVWVDPKTDKWRSTHALEFTASLDAALTLSGSDALLHLQEALDLLEECMGLEAVSDMIAALPRYVCIAALKAMRGSK